MVLVGLGVVVYVVVVTLKTDVGAAVVVDRAIGGIVTVGHQDVDLAGVVGMGEVGFAVVLVVRVVVRVVDEVVVVVPGEGVVVVEVVPDV